MTYLPLSSHSQFTIMHVESLLLLCIIFTRTCSASETKCDSSAGVSACFCKTLDEQNVNLFRGIARCRGNDTRVVTVTPLHCVTYDGTGTDTDNIVAGSCPFSGAVNRKELNGIVANLTDTMCGTLHRSGKLCGECKENYSLALNTPELKCMNKSLCKSSNWVIHFFTEFAGITLFYLTILFFNIRLTSESVSGSLFLSQIISLPINIIYFRRDWTTVISSNKHKNLAEGLSYFLEVVYGIWNLIVPTGIFKDLCVPNISPLGAFATQYTSSFIPLILILISCLFIKLYEWNFKIVIWISKPCRHFWLRFRRRIDTRATIIDTFSSFLLLSYTKLTLISMILLAPTSVYRYNGSFHSRVLLYDGTLDYFGKDHTWFVVIAIFVLCFMVLPPPFLLLFYQFRWFQVILNKIRLNGHIMALFLHSFQRGFKDGSGNSKDLRFFSALGFFLRILAFGFYTFIDDYFTLYYCLLVLALTYSFVFGIIKPYKEDYFNKAECSFGIVMSLTSVTAIYHSIHLIYKKPSLPLAIFLYLTCLYPLVYMTIYITVWFGKKIYEKNKGKILRQLRNPTDEETPETVEGTDPDAQSSTGLRVKHLIHNILVNHSLNTPMTESVPYRLSHPDMDDMEYQWCPEEQYTDTDTATTMTTGSTVPNSNDSGSMKRFKRVRPASLGSGMKQDDLGEKLLPSQPKTK